MDLTIPPDKINVLYIEDDRVSIDTVSSQLESTKYTKFNVTLKKTIKDALEFLNAECQNENDCDIDIILLDLTLPNSKGINTFLTIKKACEFLPIVITSVHEDIACKCVALGAQDYLIKPNIPNGLIVRSVKYAIRRTHLETNKIGRAHV